MKIKKKESNLFIFDFDDTLAKSNTRIFVKMKNGEIEELSSHEFATHKLEPGDLYDFSEFNKLIKSAKPIEKHVEMLRKALSKNTNKVTILTARALAFPVSYWLKSVLGLDVYVVAVNGSDPNKKKRYIREELKRGYRNIFFIDDSIPNVMAVDSLKDEFPDANIVTKVAEKPDYGADDFNSKMNESLIIEKIKKELYNFL